MNQQQREPEQEAPQRDSEKQAQPQKTAPPNHDQDLLDEGIEESFPASDSPAVSHID